MSRKLLSLAALVAAFTVIAFATEAQAGRCHSHHRNHRCCQNGNYGHGGGYGGGYSYGGGCGNGGCNQRGYGNCGYQQAGNYGCQQTTQVAMSGYANVQATCCNAQPACAVSVTPVNYSAPVPIPQPAIQQQIIAPTPGN
jgi:hypothetical protein